MKKLKIAIVLSGIQSSGGVRTLATFLYQQLKQHDDYEPTIVSLARSARNTLSVRLLSPRSWRDGVQVNHGELDGIPVTFVGAFLTELEWQRYKPRPILESLLAEYDLIQVVSGTAVLTTAVYPAHVPVCLYVATTVEQDNASYRARLHGWRAMWAKLMTHRNKRSERKILPKVDRVFVISQYTYDQLKTTVKLPNLIFAPPGTDTNIFTPAKTYHADSYLLAVGRLADPRKNCRMLLQMYHQLRQQVINPPRLRLVGQAPTTSDWALAEKWDIAPYIDVFTNVSQQELAEHYRKASLFLLTSDEEGLGIVAIEAMASGLPVVATSCGGPETIVVEGETGHLVPVNDVAALTSQVISLWKQPAQRQQMGQHGRNRAVAHFSLKATSLTFFEHYEELLHMK